MMGSGPSFRRKPESILPLRPMAVGRSNMDPSVRWDDDRRTIMESRNP
jgi:hypothetical protein